LGLEYFDASHGDELRTSFLVALHGSTKMSLKRGHKVVRVTESGNRSTRTEDFITGFLKDGKMYGRPADILSLGNDAFLFTDDYGGVVYYVYKR
jgi:glucose/arabinose dehydrogenase